MVAPSSRRAHRTHAAIALALFAVAFAVSVDRQARAGDPGGAAEPGAGATVAYTSAREFNLEYDPTEDAARVELLKTTDGGKTWEPVGYDEDCASPVLFAADGDGTYGFFVVTWDRSGHESERPGPGTPPQGVVVVDTAPPGVRLLSPVCAVPGARDRPAGGFFGPERPVEIRWRASDEYIADEPVTVEVSADRGKTWRPIATGRPAVGSFSWQAAAESFREGSALRFRVTARDRAGNEASADSADAFPDSVPPTVRPTGPRGESPSEVEVTYEADDAGGAGIESVTLHVSTDGGTTWKPAVVDEDGQSPLVWRAERAGTYGLFLSATDRAGNASRAPAPGDGPELELELSAPPPRVTLKSPSGGYYKGGDELTVEWEAVDVADGAVTVEWSPDGGETWKEIARGLPASGELAWTLPGVDTERAMVRATAASESRGKGSAVSARPFVIDSTPPSAVVRFDPSAQEELAPATVPKPPPLKMPPEPAGPLAKKASPPREILRARELIVAGRYADVPAELEPLIGREALNVEANVLLGEAKARQTDGLARDGGLTPEQTLRGYADAAAALRTALEGGDSNEARVWLGLCHLQSARVYYRRLRRADRAAAEALRAVKEYEKSLQIEPDTADERYYAGISRYILAIAGPRRRRQSHFARAGELLTAALSQETEGASPGTAGGAHWYLAEIAERTGEADRALEHWRSALGIFGEDSERGRQIRRRIEEPGER